MSEGENHHHGKNEIIIVKRHKGDHDGAHGGAWKIAYADFMTAMMAFFLVMWLVNASNEETKASVASYFNPIKLTDEKPADKGMKQPAKTAKGEQTQQTSDTKSEKPQDAAAAASGEDMTSSAGDKTAYSEAAFFENPYAVLAEIAQEVGQQANVSAKGEGGASQSGPSTGASGGEAYRDPFDPDFWSKQVDVPAQPATVVTQDTALPQKEQKATDAKAGAAKQNIADVISDSEPATPAPTAAPKNAKTELASVQKNQMPDEAADVTDAEKKTTDELRDEIAQQVAGVAGKLAEGIVVTPAEGGTLITISEKANTSMFDVGSAVPQKTLVLAMEKIGEVLSKQKGAVVIRGHTDARPYSTGGKDNWTLSMDRAHAAFYMLSRGGLDETRIKQLSGFADRRLQNTDDPLNGANRRIEILLEDS
ncbi:MotB family protein [Agrobacterium rubi]|uniref:MotB family protein n=1 Tax=Agrobacterium rubi TaxID=28099 RepID=A0AAE7R205_9HYPH|nr:MotB family protein [Agrobacterium rubi]NTE85393.1 MotB family protein [Agrobacterium rubi]NTF01325.1 MotB family protein [Agrobacterium rubi]NTF35512.1 MotB family protein [Agrobacterium rubi]OCJ48504.1 flagellar motor protein MotB [Agrobacterium rubi]QTG00695.1 MotB family protein [Agrobacterium rubi]